MSYNFLNYYYDIKKTQKTFHSLIKISDSEKIEQIQLLKVNSIWSYIVNKFSFYNNYKNQNNLPETIDSLDTLNQFPIINKSIIKENFQNIYIDSKCNKFTLTGGSSGETTKFPTGYLNAKNNFNVSLFLRNFHGISSNDLTCYIWGHSHKFGNRLILRNLKKMIKSFKNHYMNRKLFSAYELDEDNLSKITNYIFKKKPKVLFGYGSAISTLARYINSTKTDFFMNVIKIVNTSENIDKNDLITIKKVFPKSKLINEYGMAETGVIGYNQKNDFELIDVFWPHFLTQSNDNNLIVTNLSISNFPLFRYSPEDKIDIKDSINIRKFCIEGKNRPDFNFVGGNKSKKISLIMVDHILKYEDWILVFQYKISNNLLIIKIQSTLKNELYIRKKINSVIGFIPTNYKIEFTNLLEKTQAGKLIYAKY